MRKLNLALPVLVLLVGLLDARAAQWVTSAKNAATYIAPLGTPCDPLEVERDAAGGSRHYVAVPDHPGVRVPFRCKLVPDPAPPPAPSPSPTPTPTPAPTPPPSSGAVTGWSGPQYLDVPSGAPDAYVTIYGAGLGTSGTATVGGAPAAVVRWTDAAVTFHPGRSGAIALNGQGTPFAYVAVAGAKVTLVASAAGIQACIDAANPGDQCVIRGGTYSPVHPQYGSFFSVHHKGGTPDAVISIVGYPGEVVWFARTTQTRGFHFWASPGHVVIANLRIDAKGAGVGIGNSGEDCPTDIRLVANEVQNFFEDGGGDAAISGSGTNYQWLGNHVHDNGGSKLYHALYFDARCANAGNSEIAYNVIERQTGGRGIQIFGDSSRPRITNMRVHHNVIHDVGLNCLLFGDRTGAGMAAEHNVIYRCANPAFRGKTNDEGDAGSCIRINDPAAAATITNNTLVDCDLDQSADSGALTFDAQGSVVLTDNIIVSSRYAVGSPPAASNIAGNVWFGAGAAPSWDTAPVAADPRLDASFRPQNPAIAGKGAL